jgi:hypothetical protein
MFALMLVIIAIGVWFLVSALANWDWYNSIVDFAAIEGIFGESASRWCCGLLGLCSSVRA